MAPIKFEDKIKDKLNERTLKPSADAWDKLSKRLDSQEKKSNKPYWMFGIAVSIIGVLFMVFQFLNNDIKVNETPILVDAPEVIKENKEHTIATEVEIVDANNVVLTKNDKGSVKGTTNKTLVKVIKNKEFVAVAKTEKVASNEDNVPITTTKLLKKDLTFEEQKIQDVVAQIQSMKAQDNIITDAHIDALLEEAQKEITRNRLYNETTGIVDANALLQDVEAELDESSFRTKVFEALKSSYNSVKTAVAERNN